MDAPADPAPTNCWPSASPQRIASAGLLAKLVLPATKQPLQAGDIMILVRRRNAFAEEMIRQLMERRIAVAGADRMVLLDQIAIADLVALGRFALLPGDDLNLAALLKSPLVGLTEDELFELATIATGTLWAALAARRGESAQLSAARMTFCRRRSRQADLVPPFEFYSRALSRGRAHGAGGAAGRGSGRCHRRIPGAGAGP